MNKGAFKNILITILLAVTILVVFWYIFTLRKQVAILEIQKQNLLQDVEKEKQLQQKFSLENAELKSNLSGVKKKLNKVLNDYSASKKSMEDLNQKLSISQAENTALREENENIKAKLSSVAALKKAMLELRKQATKVVGQMKKKVQTQRLLEGNRGFVVKDGKSTYPAKIKIEVIPAPAQ